MYLYEKRNLWVYFKKSYTICFVKKVKYGDYEYLSLKYITDSIWFSIKMLLFNTNIFLNCYAKNLLSVQPDFFKQICEIKKSLINSVNIANYLVIYYSKYYYKLNYIGYFWYSIKK